MSHRRLCSGDVLKCISSMNYHFSLSSNVPSKIRTRFLCYNPLLARQLGELSLTPGNNELNQCSCLLLRIQHAKTSNIHTANTTSMHLSFAEEHTTSWKGTSATSVLRLVAQPSLPPNLPEQWITYGVSLGNSLQVVSLYFGSPMKDWDIKFLFWYWVLGAEAGENKTIDDLIDPGT